jgi:hypothetical protein
MVFKGFPYLPTISVKIKKFPCIIGHCIKRESNPRRVDKHNGNDPGYHYPINAHEAGVIMPILSPGGPPNNSLTFPNKLILPLLFHTKNVENARRILASWNLAQLHNRHNHRDADRKKG